MKYRRPHQQSQARSVSVQQGGHVGCQASPATRAISGQPASSARPPLADALGQGGQGWGRGEAAQRGVLKEEGERAAQPSPARKNDPSTCLPLGDFLRCPPPCLSLPPPALAWPGLALSRTSFVLPSIAALLPCSAN